MTATRVSSLAEVERRVCQKPTGDKSMTSGVVPRTLWSFAAVGGLRLETAAGMRHKARASMRAVMVRMPLAARDSAYIFFRGHTDVRSLACARCLGITAPLRLTR